MRIFRTDAGMRYGFWEMKMGGDKHGFVTDLWHEQWVLILKDMN